MRLRLHLGVRDQRALGHGTAGQHRRGLHERVVVVVAARLGVRNGEDQRERAGDCGSPVVSRHGVRGVAGNSCRLSRRCGNESSRCPARSARGAVERVASIVAPSASGRASTEGLEKWAAAALDYLPRWTRLPDAARPNSPGCSIAVAHRGKLVLEAAFGHADLARGVALTPRHRFRVASHSKTFTAAGMLKLREQGRLRLDDPVGRLSTACTRRSPRRRWRSCSRTARAWCATAPMRGQWADRRPFLDEAALRADLADGPTIEANTRFKYSNHGFGCSGLAIEAITGERYADWIAREIVAASGLHETPADAPTAARHAVRARPQRELPLGSRLAIPRRQPDPRARCGDRLRQHRRRPGALLRQPVADARSAACCRRRAAARCRAASGATPMPASSAGTASARSAARSATGTGSATRAASRAR